MRRIERAPKGVRVHAIGGTGSSADAVVLAVPIVVLAAEAIAIDLRVPAEACASLDRIPEVVATS